LTVITKQILVKEFFFKLAVPKKALVKHPYKNSDVITLKYLLKQSQM